MNALELFRSGLDTAEIAARMSRALGREIPEPLVYNEIHRERCRELGVAARYERQIRRGAA